MTISNDTGVSPWMVPPIGDETSSPSRGHDYHDFERSVAAPVPKRPLTSRVTERPDSIEPFVWVAAHGGAGATSLRQGSGAGLDLTGQWPDPELGWPSRVVLVCRSNAAGLDAAGRMLQEWVSRAVPDVRVLAVAVVADAPARPTKLMRARLVELGSIAPRVLNMPWVDQWRDHPYVADPAAAALATRIKDLLDQQNA
ncbi:DUF6668 family protein [Aeromicrobium sp. IC_218]|uniref:DUF6668 family protein n=1 Tax=Aeromicrobium sp. IC_218 TaxID=2545468 RepID=UPI00103B7117|nr:DUF6668 family protein [Aeromicrobium sp. IC_218]